MPKTSTYQKISLIFGGIIATFLILEISLRIGGVLYLSSQERLNTQNLNEKNAFRILCIGESMTALGEENSYPRQLEEILNTKESPRTYKVINKGIPAVNTNKIAQHIDGYLDKYKPNLVIAMMGINDELGIPELVEQYTAQQTSVIDNFRVVKLFELLRLHLAQKMKSQIDPIQKVTNTDVEGDPDGLWDETQEEEISIEKTLLGIKETGLNLDKSIRLAKRFRSNNLTLVNEHQEILGKNIFFQKRMLYGYLIKAGKWYNLREDYKKAEYYYLKACRIGIRDSLSYIQLGRSYKKQKLYKKALDAFIESTKITSGSVNAYIELGRTYSLMNRPDETYATYTYVLKNFRPNYLKSIEMGNWYFANNHYKEAEQSYLLAIEDNVNSSIVYDKLGSMYEKMDQLDKAKGIYEQGIKNIFKNSQKYRLHEKLAYVMMKQGKHDEAEKYLKQFTQERNKSLHPLTIANYNLIAKRVLERNIDFMVMQYPLRSIDILKENLNYTKSIKFIENKDNFEEVLSSAKMSDYFRDMFAQDFGHCTPLGNRLIAQRIKDVMLAGK